MIGRVLKGAFGTTAGRTMTAGIAAGTYNAATGDEGYATDRFVLGAAAGVLGSAALHTALRPSFMWGAAKAGARGAAGAIKRAPTMASHAASAATNKWTWYGAGAALAGGGGAYMYSEMSRQQRVRRFQNSAMGMVQGMHAGRHRR